MRATVIYNPSAGGADSITRLERGLGSIGWDVTCSLQKKELERCLSKDSDVVVVAGGDGTVSRVAKMLAGTEMPLAIVPMGTANNVARSLGIGVDPKVALEGLTRAKERRVDLGTVTSGDGKKELFVEGFGMGVFAYVIGQKEEAARKKKKLRKAHVLIADELERYEAQPYEIDIGGRDRSGEYVVVAAMNMRSFGPALGLAPDALVDDGELDVVLVRPDSREALVRHLRRAAAEGDIALPQFEVVRARELRIKGERRWTHADDNARELRGEIALDVAAGAVRVLVPS
jgi:diacylglycerol kinase family enzyme